MTDTGMLFPLTEEGRRGSLPTNRAIWADAVRPVDPDLAARIDGSDAWRQDYVRIVREVTMAGAQSAEAARTIARTGLASARSRLEFVREGTTVSAAEAGTVPPRFAFETHTVRGEAAPVEQLQVPYRDHLLAGDALLRRLGAWVSQGIIEPSAALALGRVIEHPHWLRAVGRRVVVLGAGAQTSPLPSLTSWGAEVVAVDLPVDRVSQRVVGSAEAGASAVHLPRRPGGDDAVLGADLTKELPELASWLHGLLPDEPTVLGFYVYADGAAHVQATMSADVLGTTLAAHGREVVAAYAGTPSDCYLVPEDAVEDSNTRRRSRPRRVLELPLRTASLGRLYAPAYPKTVSSEAGETMGVADAVVGQQGPNYALAKRLQRWRTITEWADGRAASFNVAPPTWTMSVTKNRLLAAGYYGARAAGLEVFAPDTMSMLMTALLMHDLHEAPSPSRDAAHPELLVARCAVHGGYWRVPHNIRTTLAYTGVVGIPRAYLSGIRVR